MNKRCLILALLFSCAIAAAARAFDTIKTAKSSLLGNIVAMDSTKVEFRQSAGGSLVKQIPVNQVETILYEGEPANLKLAKNQVLAGHYAEALAALKKIDKTPDHQKHPGLHNAKGYVGWLGHGDPVAFRNVRIKTLP